jgi:preprotein translocase subunit SecE
VTQKIVSLEQEPEKKLKGRSYISELKSELRKVSWPSREELVVCTKVILSAMFIFGFGIYFVDLIIRSSLNIVQYAVQGIIG